MTTTQTPPEYKTVICPVCWKPISRKRWDDEGCCLTPTEREAHR